MPKPLILAALLAAAWYAWSEYDNSLPTAGRGGAAPPGKAGEASRPARIVGGGAERAAGGSSP